eukprot:7363203-Alexandrium_andersonii.AAC.1
MLSQGALQAVLAVAYEELHECWCWDAPLRAAPSGLGGAVRGLQQSRIPGHGLSVRALGEALTTALSDWALAKECIDRPFERLPTGRN